MNEARPEVDVRPWERITDRFNELSREYHFKNLGGPGSTTLIDLRCRLDVTSAPVKRSWFKNSIEHRVVPFIFLVINPYLLTQTEIVAAIFGPDDDLLNYKVLTAKIDAATKGVNFIVFDVSDGEHLVSILMLGRRLSLQLVRQSGESLGRIPLENDHTFRIEYESFKLNLLASR